MTDRNDSLLLALGWTRDESGVPCASWRDLKDILRLDSSRPRPYDNLQDAVNCVPEGASWRMATVRSTHRGLYYGASLALSKVPAWFNADADTPAEALASAIMKATEPAKGQG